MRHPRPSAMKARDTIRATSMTESEDDYSSVSDSSASRDAHGSNKEGMSVLAHMSHRPTVNSLDKFTYQASTDRPWISTIRGPATRLDSLKTVKSSDRSRSSKSYSKRRSYSDESNEDSFESSSESESSASESDRDRSSKKHSGSRSGSRLHKASGIIRSSQRIRETQPRKYAQSSSEYSSGSESSSRVRSKHRVAPPKVSKKSTRSPSSSENASSDYDSEEFRRSDYSSGDEPPTDNETDVEEPGKSPIIDKILAKRKSDANPDQWQYLVKWKNRSYLHCEWLSSSDMMRDTESDKRSLKMKNFNLKHPYGPRNPTVPSFENKYFFNPMFEHIEKIIAVRHVAKSSEYLVKWQGIPYGESTWEFECDLKPSQFKHAMDHFINLNDPDRCETRLKFNSRDFRRKPGADATVDFSKCLEPVNDGKGPTEYLYRPVSGKRDHEKPFKIFDFQKEGISWLLYNWNQGRGSMLADEMGLGKTVQTSVTLAEMKHHADVNDLGQVAFLIIAPLSTIEQWKREIRKWTDLEPIVFHGNKRDRNVIRKYEFEEIEVSSGKIFPRKSDFFMPKFDVLITTFEMVSSPSMADLFSNFVWTCMVVDEAHKLKSSEGKARTFVMQIPTRHRMLLTGTPIQNDITELWNLLHLCSPSAWPDVEEFLAEFGNLKSADMTQRLQAKIQPFLLQRKKAEVLAHLVPAKEETIISVELTKLQKETYRAVYEKNLTILSGGGNDKKNVPTLTNVHMELRKCCNHPFLVQGVEDRVTRQIGNEYNKLMDYLILSSGKMVFLDKLLEKLWKEKSKILIFSQFTMMLDLIEDYLRWRGYMFERLDGAVKTQQRQEAIDRFNKTPSPEEESEFGFSGSFVFLLSTKAGGVGLNLTAANYVLLFDHDWNPQNDLQAQARCHRIGQTKEVQIFRLITRGTYEEKMFQVASQKLGLEQAVMSGDSKSGQSKLSKEDMDRLLKEGAYAMLEDGDENEQKFCSENVDEMLKNRSKTVSTFVSSGIGGGGFSKARFQVNTEDDQSGEIDVNDPLFWSKMAAAGSLVAEATSGAADDELLDYSQRKGRAQFGNNRQYAEEDISLDSDFSDDVAEKQASAKSSSAPKKTPEEIAEEVRKTRMKKIFKFLFNFGPIWNKEIFDQMYEMKFGRPSQPSAIPIPEYVDMLALIIGLYVLARDNSLPNKYDEIHFSPTVRFALGIYNKIASSGTMETPPHNAEALNVDGMVPDFLASIDRTNINVPGSIGTKVPKYIADAIPRTRTYRRLVGDLDAFNEMKFLSKYPELMKKIPNMTPTWSMQDDVELIRLALERGKDDLYTAACEKWSGESGLPTTSTWPWNRVEKLLPKFSFPRSVQLTLLIASYGYPDKLFDRAIRATGYQPWIRKFSCGESCLELIEKDREETREEELERLKLLTSVDVELPPQSDDSSEQSFCKSILVHLPPDTPFTPSDVLDYAKALLYRVVSALGKKSDKHDSQVQAVLRVTKQNENYFLPNVPVSLLWPQRELNRIEAFKLLWRFQTLHFVRSTGWSAEPLAPITTTFIPIAQNFGLDNWEMVTTTNRHLTASEILKAVIKFVCQQMIEKDEVSVSAVPAIPKKRQPETDQAQPPPAKRPTGSASAGTIVSLFSSMANTVPPSDQSQINIE